MIPIKLNRHFLWDQVGQHQTGWFTLISNRYHPVIISIIIIITIIISIIVIIIIIFLITISIINVICIVIFITIAIITSSSTIGDQKNSVFDILMTFASLLLTHI